MTHRVSGTPDGTRTPASFGKSRRLLKAADYRQVFDHNEARASHRYFLLLARRAPGEQQRLGLVVAKKNVKLAVQRNKVKRIVRDTFRLLPDNDPPLDMIFLARRGVEQLDKRQLSSILREQWRKLTRQIARSSDPEHRAD
jgi:ribonuclease P protein component